MEKKHNIGIPMRLELTKGGSPKIVGRDGFSIANLSNTVHKHRTPQGEFIVEACNNYERLQAENQKMREILSEIMNGMSAHLDYQDLMDEELTAEERATRANVKKELVPHLDRIDDIRLVWNGKKIAANKPK